MTKQKIVTMLMMQKMEMSIAMNITDETSIQSFVDDHHHT